MMNQASCLGCFYRKHPLLIPHLGQGGKDKPLFLPDFDNDIQLFPTIAIRISRLGKAVSAKFANRYYDAWTVCLSARAMNVLNKLKSNALPWNAACSFDGSFIQGIWHEFPVSNNFSLTLTDCQNRKTELHTNFSPQKIDEIIENISSNMMLKTGDIITINPTDSILHFRARIGLNIRIDADNAKILELRIK